MAKHPPKPEGQTPRPRFKSKTTKHISETVEAARRLTESEVVAADINVEKYFTLDDRSFAIIRAANVENALEIAISRKITIHKGERRSLFRSDGPLGSFSNKITMGYALEIFGEITKQNLDVIRHVRNVFAHTKKHIDFNTKEIVDLCEFLKFPPILKENPDFGPEEEKPQLKPSTHAARNAYHISTFVTEISLIRFSSKITESRLTRLGAKIKPEPKPRVIFDESLP